MATLTREPKVLARFDKNDPKNRFLAAAWRDPAPDFGLAHDFAAVVAGDYHNRVSSINPHDVDAQRMHFFLSSILSANLHTQIQGDSSIFHVPSSAALAHFKRIAQEQYSYHLENSFTIPLLTLLPWDSLLHFIAALEEGNEDTILNYLGKHVTLKYSDA